MEQGTRQDELVEKASRVVSEQIFGHGEPGPHSVDIARALFEAALLADPDRSDAFAELEGAFATVCAERDLVVWLHAEAAWRVAGFDALTVSLARINKQLQDRIAAALAVLRREGPFLPARQAAIAALQGDQPTKPEGSR